MGESRKEQDRPCAPCPDCGAEMYEKFWGNGGWARTDKATGRMHSVSDCIRRMKRQLDEARAQCSAWIRNSNDKAAEVNMLATDLDEARALVEAATCFAFGGTSRPAFAYRTQFGHVDNDVTWCAGVPEGDDVECESRDSAIAKARALAKEDGK